MSYVPYHPSLPCNDLRFEFYFNIRRRKGAPVLCQLVDLLWFGRCEPVCNIQNPLNPPYLNILPIAAHYSPLNQPKVFTFQGKLYKTYNGTLKEKNTYLKKKCHVSHVICHLSPTPELEVGSRSRPYLLVISECFKVNRINRN